MSATVGKTGNSQRCWGWGLETDPESAPSAAGASGLGTSEGSPNPGDSENASFFFTPAFRPLLCQRRAIAGCGPLETQLVCPPKAWEEEAFSPRVQEVERGSQGGDNFCTAYRHSGRVMYF